MKRRAGFSSGGVLIHRPVPRAPRTRIDLIRACLQEPLSQSSGHAQDHGIDAQALSLLQELAFVYAMDQSRNVVRTILLKVNKKCYDDAHNFFQRHMSYATERTSASHDSTVLFPGLTKIPTVGIVSGSDASFSDVWMNPLCQVIHRSFPVILRVRDDFADARHWFEWVLQRLDDYHAFKTSEQAWLASKIDAFVQRGEPASTRPETTNGHRLRPRSRSNRGQAAGTTKDDSSDEEYLDEHASAPSSESDDGGASVSTARRAKRRRTRSAPAKPSIYSSLLLDELFAALQSRLDLISNSADPALGYAAALQDLVLEDLRLKLTQSAGDIEASILVYETCIAWITACVSHYRERTPPSSEMLIATAEFSLAILMHQVLTQLSSFLRSCEPELTSVRVLVQDKLAQVEHRLMRHEDLYHLHQFNQAEYDEVRSQREPFLLVCIESLDRFNIAVLKDTLDLWGHHVASIQDKNHSPRAQLGFIFGVTSTTSQTLRLLGNAITRKLDIQFFPLEDSKTRSDDIIEELFVHNAFPLCLRGDTLRILNERHLTSQSNTVFMQVLELVALTHFQDQPWSFLSRFAFNRHHRAPIEVIKSPSYSLRQRIRESQISGRTASECVSNFSHEGLEILCGRFGEGVDPLQDLEDELAWFRERHVAWATGWKCFRAACDWFDVKARGEPFVECLSMALDGELKTSRMAQWIVVMLEAQPVRVVVHLLSEWASMASQLMDKRLHQDIIDLFAVAQHVMDTATEDQTIRMQTRFRAELKDFFLSRILSLVDRDDFPKDSVRGLVRDWCTVSPQHIASLAQHATMNPHEDIVVALRTQNSDLFSGSTFVSDMSLAFFFYEEHAAANINLGDWFREFAIAVNEEEDSSQREEDSDRVDELQARFARAIATMRLWGYITGPDAGRGSSRYEEMRVQKRIFL